MATALAPTVPDGAAGSILDDEMLSDGFVELLHQDTRDAIDRTAGREWHDTVTVREG